MLAEKVRNLKDFFRRGKLEKDTPEVDVEDLELPEELISDEDLEEEALAAEEAVDEDLIEVTEGTELVIGAYDQRILDLIARLEPELADQTADQVRKRLQETKNKITTDESNALLWIIGSKEKGETAVDRFTAWAKERSRWREEHREKEEGVVKEEKQIAPENLPEEAQAEVVEIVEQAQTAAETAKKRIGFWRRALDKISSWMAAESEEEETGPKGQPDVEGMLARIKELLNSKKFEEQDLNRLVDLRNDLITLDMGLERAGKESNQAEIDELTVKINEKITAGEELIRELGTEREPDKPEEEKKEFFKAGEVVSLGMGKDGQELKGTVIGYNNNLVEVKLGDETRSYQEKVLIDIQPTLGQIAGRKVGRLRERVGEIWGTAKELALNPEVQKAMGKAAYETVTSVFGVKFAADLVGAAFGKGDIAGYFKERKLVKAEKEEIQGALAELVESARSRKLEKEIRGEEEAKAEGRTEEWSATKRELRKKIEAYKKKLESAAHLSPDDKRAFREQLGTMIAANVENEEITARDLAKDSRHILGTFLETKIKGTKLVKDALNFALTASGLVAVRGVTYGVAAGIERLQKTGTAMEKEHLAKERKAYLARGESSRDWKEDAGHLLKDLFVNSTRETVQALAFRGDQSKGRKAANFFQAAGVVARGLGIGGAALGEIMSSSASQSIGKSAETFLNVYEKSGVTGAVGHNFVNNAERMLQVYTHPIDTVTGRLGQKAGRGAVPEEVPTRPASKVSESLVRVEPRVPEEKIATGRWWKSEELGRVLEGKPPPPRPPLMEQPEIKPPFIDTRGKPSVSLTETIKGKGFQEAPLPEKHAQLEKLAEEQKLAKWEGVIDKKHNSIWSTTRDLVRGHAAELGYDEKTSGPLDKWLERQTANMVEQLRTDQGGKLTDLVHEGDKVTLYVGADNKPYLRFGEAESGPKAGFLHAVEAKPTPLTESELSGTKLQTEISLGTRLEQHLPQDFPSVTRDNLRELLTEFSTSKFRPGQELSKEELMSRLDADQHEYYRFRAREALREYLEAPNQKNLDHLRERVIPSEIDKRFGPDSRKMILASFGGKYRGQLVSLQAFVSRLAEGNK